MKGFSAGGGGRGERGCFADVCGGCADLCYVEGGEEGDGGGDCEKEEGG